MSDIEIKLEKYNHLKNTFRTLNVYDFVLHVPSINQIIYDYLNWKEQLHYNLLNKVFSLLDVKIIWTYSVIRKIITNDTLLKYSKCEKLYMLSSNNNEITDINHIKNLSELRFTPHITLRIGDNGIKNLFNLTILKIRGNTNITNINHLTKLVELNASNECSITNDGIKYLMSFK